MALSARGELLHILFGAQRGGCEVEAQMLIQQLPGVRHRVLVLGPQGPMCEPWEQAGATVATVGDRPTPGRKVVSTVKGFVSSRPPTAVMIWHGLVQLPQLIHALNPLKVPMCAYAGNPAHTMSRRVDWKYCLLGRAYPPRGPLPTFVCCSHYVEQTFYSSRYLRAFPRVVAHNGVEIPPGAAHVPRAILQNGSPVIGMVARLDAIKDHATLIRAFAAVRQSFPGAILELAGDGREAAALKTLTSKVGVESGVRFLGDVADVYAQMERWDLFAYATTEREGLGNAVAEAMMYGLPCAVTDVGPMREFAGAGDDTVRLVPPANPVALAREIIALLPDVGARTKLAEAGRSFALSRFHPRVFARKYAEVLNLPTSASSELKAS